GDRPDQPIADYVGELRAGDRLSEFEVEDDDETGVLAVFALSYAALPAAAARVFRLLSLVPGPDVTTEAVAALADEAARSWTSSPPRISSPLPGRTGTPRTTCCGSMPASLPPGTTTSTPVPQPRTACTSTTCA